MKVIGFANKFYTLWDVSEAYKEYVSEYDFYWKVDYAYIQNLSMDLETAKEKAGTDKIDTGLKGDIHFSARTSEKISERPEYIFAFGKYVGEDIRKSKDLSYVLWYYNNTNNSYAKTLLLNNGYKEYNDGNIVSIFSESEYAELIDRDNKKSHIESLEMGYHFSHKKRMDNDIKVFNKFSFESMYGTAYVVEIESKCGKYFKYVGNNAEFTKYMPNDEFITVRATVEHNEYKGEKETRLKRISF